MGTKPKEKWDEILEVVLFIKDNAVSKQDLADLRCEFKQDIFNLREEMTGKFYGALAQTENRLMTHIDGIVKMHTTLDEEQIAIRALYYRHEEQIQRIARHTNTNLE